MKYKVTHATEYYYGDPVPLCHNLVHLKPRTTDRQSVLSHTVMVLPNPTTRSERLDFFGNPVNWFSIQEPHDSLKIVARSLVELTAPPPHSQLSSPSWEQAAEMLRTRRDTEILWAGQFVFDSPFVIRHPKLAEYARPSFAPGRPLLEGLDNLTQRIYTDFKFDAGVTTIGTPVLEVLEHHHGVCQDFAHLQIGCLRSLGLAARYVSGYLVTKPPPGKPRLVGADASHAWLAAYVPGVGWIDLDPTNGVAPTTGHITLAWARDYTDVSPVRGVVVGGRRHALRVAVDVEPLNGEEKAEGQAKADGQPQPDALSKQGTPPKPSPAASAN
jgi:transglutaminase-like putative cysteine protease